ncbi:hypothetical protein ACTVPQ_24645 [Serratia bockelmannii]|uniref:hypothetical protein n=1 Tax=Serratia bockelmannii TaxID=2703793 RepID=UPI003FA6A3DF
MTLSKMKNPLFDAHHLYIMLRLSAIEYFPYEYRGLGADAILSLFMQHHMGLKFTVENKESERGLVFSGESCEMYKDIQFDEDKKRDRDNRSPVWYLQHIMKFHKEDLSHLNDDLNVMRIWLEDNDYLKNYRPTDKFLREQYLVIATNKNN